MNTNEPIIPKTPGSESTAVAKRKIDLYRVRNALLSEGIHAYVQPAGKDTYLAIRGANGYSNGIELADDGEIDLFLTIKPGDEKGWKALRIIDQFVNAQPSANPADFVLAQTVVVSNPDSAFFRTKGVVVRVGGFGTYLLQLEGFGSKEFGFNAQELKLWENDDEREAESKVRSNSPIGRSSKG